jgi:hydroxymethylbilane synthase
MITVPLRIGTRGSPLALAQTAEVRRRLAAVDPTLAETGAVESIVIKTTGDRIRDRPLAEIGGKGLFTKEIDEAMLAGRIDVAVHSMKDLPTWLPDGIVLAGMLPREDPRDALICARVRSLAALPAGAVVGTASLRRKAQILHRRPDLVVVPLRGNVHTRLRKVSAGEVDATLLALAGLRRLGMGDAATAVIETDEMLPAVAQGAIGVTCRAGDRSVRDALAALDHPETTTRVTAERAMLEVLDGSCRTPIAALAEVDGGGGLTLSGLIARPDGSELLETARAGRAEDARFLGRDAGDELRRRAGPGFFEDRG